MIDVMLLALALGAYLYVVSGYLGLPPVGFHAWDESQYLAVLHNIVAHNAPFLFLDAYDLQHPVFYSGFLFYWAEFLSYAFASFLGASNEIIIFRASSIAATFASAILLTAILNEFGVKRLANLTSVVLFVASPLAVYFGWKAILEPILVCIFLFSQLIVVRALKRRTFPTVPMVVSLIMGGSLMASKFDFAPFMPLWLLPPLFFGGHEVLSAFRRLAYVLLAVAAVVAGAAITLFPSQLLYPQYFPAELNILAGYLVGNAEAALSIPMQFPNAMLTFIFRVTWIQTTVFFPLCLMGMMSVRRIRVEKPLKIYFLVLSFVTLLFLLLTYPNDAVNFYQAYYAVPWLVLGTGLFLQRLGDTRHKGITGVAILALVLLSVAISGYNLNSFYGIGSSRVYSGIDPYGTIESYVVGLTIRYVLNQTGNPAGYALVQSPTMIYPIDHESLNFQDMYVWNSSLREYTALYSLFDNESQFVAELETKNIAILTLTPDVSAAMTPSLGDYIARGFTGICHTSHTTIMLNTTLYVQYPFIGQSCDGYLAGLAASNYYDKIATEGD